MKTLKKWIAFMLAAGLIVSAVKITAMTVLASSHTATIDGVETDPYPSGEIERNENGGRDYIGPELPNGIGLTDRWYNTNEGQWYRIINTVDGRRAWVPMRNSSSSSSTKLTQEDIEAIESQAADAAEQQGASDEGFLEVGDMYRAAEKNMSAGEYYNNAVISTPGIENAVTVGQGGNLVVNGVVTNMTAMISKVTNRAYVDSVRVNQPEGRLLNVVEVSYPAFDATINFYMPSVTAEMEVVALQYDAGTWVNVDVVEVREDHVVLNMKKSGIVAFVAK